MLAMGVSIILLAILISLLLLFFVHLNNAVKQSNAHAMIRKTVLLISKESRNASPVHVLSVLPSEIEGKGVFYSQGSTLIFRQSDGSTQVLLENLTSWNATASAEEKTLSFCFSFSEGAFSFDSEQSAVSLNNYAPETTQSGTGVIFSPLSK